MRRFIPIIIAAGVAGAAILASPVKADVATIIFSPSGDASGDDRTCWYFQTVQGGPYVWYGIPKGTTAQELAAAASNWETVKFSRRTGRSFVFSPVPGTGACGGSPLADDFQE